MTKSTLQLAMFTTDLNHFYDGKDLAGDGIHQNLDAFERFIFIRFLCRLLRSSNPDLVTTLN